jgi:(p)ppGpp synthase/HD superfamily hydrolase
MVGIEKAINLALTNHQGQKDKAGRAYIFHPIRVMLKFNDEKLQCIAILHDILEDTELTETDLVEHGFSDDIVEAVVCLSRNQNEIYQDFIERLSKNKLARAVKIADIEDNLDISRLKFLNDQDLRRINKYKKALNYLHSL